MKKIAFLFFSCLFLLVLFGCSGTGAGGETSSTDNEEGVTELTWQFWGGDDDRELWEERADMVNEVYPDIKVTLQVDDFNTYWTKLQTQLASGTAADIIGMRSTEVPVYAEMGAIEPLDQFIESNADFDIDDFNEGIINGMSHNSELYGLPYDHGAYTLYYNKDMFDKNNVPYPETGMTWDDFVDRAKQLTNPDEQEYGYGFATTFWSTVPWTWQSGADYLDEEGNYTMNQPGTVEAFQFLSDLVHQHKVAPSGAELAATEFLDMWQSGKLGMVIEGPWNVISFNKFANFEYDVSTLPVSPSGESESFTAGSGFSVNADTEHKEEAFKAISVITGKESLAELAGTGRAYPARDSAVKEFNTSAGLENVEKFKEQADNARAFKTTPSYSEAEDLINQEIEQIFFEEVDVKATLDTLQEKLDSEINN